MPEGWSQPIPGFTPESSGLAGGGSSSGSTGGGGGIVGNSPVPKHTHDSTDQPKTDQLGNIDLGKANFIRGGTTTYDDGVGLWMGYDSDAYKFFIGDSAGNHMKWTGTALSITGSITATAGTIGGWTISSNALTSGNISINSSTEQILMGSATAPLTGVGIFLGKDGANYEFRAGDPANSYMHWDGTNLDVNATVLSQGGTAAPRGFSIVWFGDTLGNGTARNLASGYSDDATPIWTLSAWNKGSGAGQTYTCQVGTATQYGLTFYPARVDATNLGSDDAKGAVYIGGNFWVSELAGANKNIYKDGAIATWSGTTADGPLGHDPTNSYLLILESTTSIVRYSGISGTTLTNINSNITLDTAVTETAGFFFDDTNTRYICCDNGNSLIRRFDSSGTTVDTQAYPTLLSSASVVGCVPVGGRIHLVIQDPQTVEVGGSNVGCAVSAQLIPTNMTI